MSESPDPLTRLSEAAHRAGPVPVTEAALDAMTERAMVAAHGRRRETLPRAVRWAVAAAALVAIGWGIGYGVRTRPTIESQSTLATRAAPVEPTERVGALTRLRLPTGDHLVRAGDGEVAIHEMSPTRLSLHRGQALFDVAPRRPGTGFHVETPHLQVEVIGTVFAVDVGTEATHLRVFQGRVRVIDPQGRRRTLGRGQELSSSPDSEGFVLHPALVSEGWAAAARRDSNRSDQEGALDRTSTPPAPAPTLAQVRRWLAEGSLAPALAATARMVLERPESGDWAIARGDALRAAGRRDAASRAYERAIERLAPSRAAHAGYLAADLRMRRDPRAAIALLTRSGAAASGSPIEERAIFLLVRAQLAAGDSAGARASARLYRSRFPSGPERAWMRRVEGDQGETRRSEARATDGPPQTSD